MNSPLSDKILKNELDPKMNLFVIRLKEIDVIRQQQPRTGGIIYKADQQSECLLTTKFNDRCRYG